MRTIPLRPVISAALAVGAFLLLQACAPAAPPADQINVAQAFETSEVMAFKPYTRTIFSTTDF